MNSKFGVPEIVLELFGFDSRETLVQPFGTGLINRTWKVSFAGSLYILQQINETVFNAPIDISTNIEAIAKFLSRQHPDYLFISPIKTRNGDSLVINEAGRFRAFPFVFESRSFDVVHSSNIAHEAAMQFGRFTRLLDDFPVDTLKITIPSFHDLELRYKQFLAALEDGDLNRIKEAAPLITRLKKFQDLVARYTNLRDSKLVKLRVTHHDTKISNVLFNEAGEAICVIDLDTVMPGYFISDLGDMMRTYLSPVSEEEQDLDKIEVRDDYYAAIVSGFLHEMKDVLLPGESQFIFYAGQFLIYMQALRFLTDHLLKDRYYRARYPRHNFHRALNQTVLLERYTEKRERFERLF